MKEKINLVTVVGDFHKDLTLTQMIKHYSGMVDEIYINYYNTSGTDIDTEDVLDALKDLLNIVELDLLTIKLIVRNGRGKYDWQEVTNIYNETTSMNPDRYWIIADCDEFQYWPMDPREIAAECRKKGYTFVTGGFLDRIGSGGKLEKISEPGDDLNRLFPCVGFFRYPTSGACPNKVVMVRGDQRVSSGQHYALFPDGSNSWGRKHRLRYPVEDCFVQVHHFKWDESVLQRLQDVSKSGCSYHEEYAKMYRALSGGTLQTGDFGTEVFDESKGYSSYTQWDKLRETIISI